MVAGLLCKLCRVQQSKLSLISCSKSARATVGDVITNMFIQREGFIEGGRQRAPELDDGSYFLRRQRPPRSTAHRHGDTGRLLSSELGAQQVVSQMHTALQRYTLSLWLGAGLSVSASERYYKIKDEGSLVLRHDRLTESRRVPSIFI